MSQGERRSVGVLLGVGIFVMPWLFVWLLLRRGYSMLSRGLGFGWFALLMVSTFNAIHHAHDIPTSAHAAASLAPATASAIASATASAAPPEPHHDCPPNSSGIGSFEQPCEAKGSERLMTVKWKKTDDNGPNFSIQNVGKATIVYGKIAVYFYDKSGKQLDLNDDTETPPKVRPFLACSGNFFQGVMKPGESATLTFSCVPKKIVPDGTTTIEAEMQMVGFTDESKKKIDFYWRNTDLTPNVRPKGGADSAPDSSLWTYESFKDNMRGSTDSYASLESVNSLSFGFPYNRGKTRGRIRLQNARSSVDARLEITQGQFTCGFEGCSVSVKFDDGPIQKLWCNRSADGESKVLFVGDPKTFIARIKRARHILVEAEFFQEGSQQLEFMPAGLVWKY